jgi:hypothetical protein
VPSLVLFLAKSALVAEYDLSSVLSVGSGAAPLSVEAAHEFKHRLPSVAPITQGEREGERERERATVGERGRRKEVKAWHGWR